MSDDFSIITMTKQQYQDAVRIAAEVEREACAKIADEIEHGIDDDGFTIAGKIAAAIRARSQKGEQG